MAHVVYIQVMYTISVITEPASEPVSVAQLKLHLRLNNGTDEDDLLSSYISAARITFERMTGLAIKPQTVRQYLQRWPDSLPHDLAWQYGYDYWSAGQPYYQTVAQTAGFGGWPDRIVLMRQPVTSIVAFKYYDTDGQLQTVSSYSSDLASNPPSVWTTNRPTLWQQGTPVAYVEYATGYATVPAPITAAIRLLAAHWYEFRSPVLSGTIVAEVPMSFKALVSLYRTGTQLGDYRQ